MFEMLIVEVIKHGSPCLPSSASLDCYSESKECVIKTKLTKGISSRPEVFCKKGVPEKSCKTHRKTTLLESLLNKVAGLQLANL